MAFLTPLPLTPLTRPAASTSSRQHSRPRAMPPKATVALPTTPSEPADRPTQPETAPWMPLPAIVHEIRTPEQYDRLSQVAKENGQLLVVDFMASWCRKCLYLLPKLRKIARAVPSCYYCAVDVNKVSRLPKQFQITKMPTFVFVRDQQTVATIVGGASPGKVAQDVETAIRRLADERE